MKKKLLLCALMVQSSSMLFAQSARTDINTVITNWIIPGACLCIIVGFIVHVINNLDGLRGKNGASKSEAWLAVGEGVAYVLAIVVAIGFVATTLASMAFAI